MKAELRRRQAGVCSEATDKDKHYVALHQQIVEAKGISWTSLAPSGEIAKSEWFKILPQREKEIIAYYTTTVPAAIAIDCSQRIDRVSPPTEDMQLFTLTPGAKNYLVAKIKSIGDSNAKMPNRLLTGWESLALQGFPVETLCLDWCSDPQLHDLAGNSFPGTCLCAIYLAVFANIPQVTTSEEDEDGFNIDEIRLLMKDGA